MFYLKFARLFGKSWSRKSTRRTPVRKPISLSLKLEHLEDRMVPANLLGATANSFAVLGGSTVTNTGPTIIGGNLGVSPGAAITGFPPGIVTPPGTIHAADAVALQAQTEVTTAYNTLAGLPFNTSMSGQDLGGLTLIPGVYNFATSAQLTGTLTLDGQGDPNAVFIFQIGSTLTTASNSTVVFLNGAQDDEVYWQVGSSATLGTNTAFAGNIVALASITLTTSASIGCGRALARNGAVTMDSNNVFTCASISGTKFNDINGDGVRQPGDPGLAGITVFLDINVNGALDAGERSIITDVNGNYRFTSLDPGTYRVREVQPAGSTQTTANPADITLSGGQDVSGVLFGNFQLVSIGGLKFNDLNGDGVRQPGEPGLQGVTVFLDANGNGALDAGERNTITNINGTYSFVNVGLGTYRVREVQPAGSTRTTANPADIVASSGSNISGVLFGNFQLVSIDGLKFNDLNGDGVRQPGEPGLQGVTVFLDANNNGVLDAGERSTTSDVNGNYSFANVGPGTYRVREVQQPGLLQTTPNPADITLSSGQNITGVTFGDFRLVAISGLKFQDTNGNGVRDTSETGLPGVTVFLDANNNGVLDPGETSIVTDANGNFSFGNLGPGTSRVRQVQQAGLTQTTPNPIAMTVTSGQNVPGVNFGDVRTGVGPLLPRSTVTGARPPEFEMISKRQLLGSTIVENMNGIVLAEANFVSGLYQNVLGRSADVAGLTFWVQMLQDGFSRDVVAASFWQSPEHRVLEVNQFYATFLNRAPSIGEQAIWVNALVSGTSEVDVMRGFLMSAEYQASHSGNTAFVNGLYSNVLGRAFDPSGQAVWLQALANGVSREAVAQAFLTSAEAGRRVLGDYYTDFLGRAADPAGEQFWLGQLQSGRFSLKSVGEAFLSSDEYFARVNRVSAEWH